MKIVFATNNKNKLSEIRSILGGKIEILSLADINCHADIPETADTLEGNALQKANYVYEHFHLPVFADDTGLEVDALGGEPGVHSARYAEETDHDSEANMAKLLRKLEGNDMRSAHFRTVIALIEIVDGKPQTKCFEGRVEGSITTGRRGAEGFGYDPIFVPEGFSETFAQLGLDVKNTISHRARAVKLLADYLLKP